MDLLSTVLHEMGNAMGSPRPTARASWGWCSIPGVRTLPGDNTPLHSAAAARRGAAAVRHARRHADLRVGGPQHRLEPAGLDVTKAKKGDVAATAQPAWVGDFVNHLAPHQ